MHYYLYFVAFVFCHFCILSNCVLSLLCSVFLFFVIFVNCCFVFCRICILSFCTLPYLHFVLLHFVIFVFCLFCILSLLHYVFLYFVVLPELCFDRVVKWLTTVHHLWLWLRLQHSNGFILSNCNCLYEATTCHLKDCNKTMKLSDLGVIKIYIFHPQLERVMLDC